MAARERWAIFEGDGNVGPLQLAGQRGARSDAPQAARAQGLTENRGVWCTQFFVRLSGLATKIIAQFYTNGALPEPASRALAGNFAGGRSRSKDRPKSRDGGDRASAARLGTALTLTPLPRRNSTPRHPPPEASGHAPPPVTPINSACAAAFGPTPATTCNVGSGETRGESILRDL